MSDRIEFTHGGVPSEEEVAAVVIALTPVDGGDAERDAGPPPWRRAAIIEGLGGRPVSSAWDLARRGPIEPC